MRQRQRQRQNARRSRDSNLHLYLQKLHSTAQSQSNRIESNRLSSVCLLLPLPCLACFYHCPWPWICTSVSMPLFLDLLFCHVACDHYCGSYLTSTLCSLLCHVSSRLVSSCLASHCDCAVDQIRSDSFALLQIGAQHTLRLDYTLHQITLGSDWIGSLQRARRHVYCVAQPSGPLISIHAPRWAQCCAEPSQADTSRATPFYSHCFARLGHRHDTKRYDPYVTTR